MQVFLLPGFDGTGQLFAPLRACLAGKFDPVDVQYERERTFDDYINSIRSLLPERDAVVVAESFSGPIALELMGREPSRFRCAVLCATFSTSPFRYLTSLAQWVPTPLLALNAISERLICEYCLDPRPDPALRDELMTVSRKLPPDVIRSRLTLLSKLDSLCRLEDVNVPVLYLQATRDRLVSAELSDDVTRRLPQCQVKLIDGPHLLLQSRPKECAEAIERFLLKYSP